MTPGNDYRLPLPWTASSARLLEPTPRTNTLLYWSMIHDNNNGYHLFNVYPLKWLPFLISLNPHRDQAHGVGTIVIPLSGWLTRALEGVLPFFPASCRTRVIHPRLKEPTEKPCGFSIHCFLFMKSFHWWSFSNSYRTIQVFPFLVEAVLGSSLFFLEVCLFQLNFQIYWCKSIIFLVIFL